MVLHQRVSDIKQGATKGSLFLLQFEHHFSIAIDSFNCVTYEMTNKFEEIDLL